MRVVTSICLPNANPHPGPKINYKLGFERLIARASELIASGAPVMLAGDYNEWRVFAEAGLIAELGNKMVTEFQACARSGG
jgi:exonuclease III